MKQADALIGAELVLRAARVEEVPPLHSYLEYAEVVAGAAKELTPKARERLPFNFREWAEAWAKLYHSFDRALEADPMLAYQPAHEVAQAFHSSKAKIRYNRSANRTSKSQTGYAEHYFVATGQHRWREFPHGQTASCVIGVNFSQYAKRVFETKMIAGEADNPLSPMFPEHGKWFYHYDPRQHELRIACPDCAEEGKAQSCPHPKSTITLLSDESSKGWEVFQGAQYNLVHFDEHVDEGFFQEAKQRIKTATGGCIIVTGTPLFGTQAWEYRLLENLALAGPPANLQDPTDPASPPIVEVFTIDQFAAGLVDHKEIRQDMASMDEYEIESRIYGRASEVAKNPVFNRKKLSELRKKAEGLTPERLELGPAKGDIEVPFVECPNEYEFTVEQNDLSPLRVWKRPAKGQVYVLAVDPAAGLTEGDASVISVLKPKSVGVNKMGFDLVAQWHGKKNQIELADEVLKIGIWYNYALVAIELTGGYGRPVMQILKDKYYYWNLFRDSQVDVAQAEPLLDSRFGVETNAQTKGPMVSVLQYMVQHDLVEIPCLATLSEMAAFEQESTTATGIALLNPRYRGTKGGPDDRVMSLVIGSAVIQTYKPLQYQVLFGQPTETIKGEQQVETFVVGATSVPKPKGEVAAWWDSVHNQLAENENSSDI